GRTASIEERVIALHDSNLFFVLKFVALKHGCSVYIISLEDSPVVIEIGHGSDVQLRIVQRITQPLIREHQGHRRTISTVNGPHCFRLSLTSLTPAADKGDRSKQLFVMLC